MSQFPWLNQVDVCWGLSSNPWSLQVTQCSVTDSASYESKWKRYDSQEGLGLGLLCIKYPDFRNKTWCHMAISSSSAPHSCLQNQEQDPPSTFLQHRAHLWSCNSFISLHLLISGAWVHSLNSCCCKLIMNETWRSFSATTTAEPTRVNDGKENPVCVWCCGSSALTKHSCLITAGSFLKCNLSRDDLLDCF